MIIRFQLLAVPLVLASLQFFMPVHAEMSGAANAVGTAPADSLKRAADLFFARHEYARADSLYRRLLARDSTDAALTALLASCLLRRGSYQPALDLYRRALGLDPDMNLCYLGLVTCCYKLGQIDRAADWAGKVRGRLRGQQLKDWNKLVSEMFPLIAGTENK